MGLAILLDKLLELWEWVEDMEEVEDMEDMEEVHTERGKLEVAMEVCRLL